MKRVLIASPVRQKPNILAEFLACLARLETTGLNVEYAFIDDNDVLSEQLQAFAVAMSHTTILRGTAKSQIYQCNEQTHFWQDDIIWKVAHYKDIFIQMARDRGFDYLFLVDSDLALHPKTLIHLVSLGKDIVSEVFWTRWQKDVLPLPQVWLGGQYRLHAYQPGENLKPEEIAQRQNSFLRMLQCPGLYKVGGLGACTLISAAALQAGVSFKKIYNLISLRKPPNDRRSQRA